MSCKLNPEVKNKDGQLVESKLFSQLTSLTKDREMAKMIYALTKEPDFIKEHALELDENGEPTIESLSKVINMDNLLSQKDMIAKYSKELNTNKLYDSIEEVISKVTAFNVVHTDFVATFNNVGGAFKIQVDVKNSDNSEVADNLQKSVQVNNQLLAILNTIGFTVVLDSTLTRVHGVFDPVNAKITVEGLKTVIRVANSLEGQQAIPEEFAHLMIEGLYSQPLVQRVLKLLNTTGVVEEVLGDSFDRYMELYKGDLELMKKEAAGKILSNYLKGQDLKSMDKYSNIIARLWENAKRLFRKTSTQSIDSIINEVNRNSQNLASQILQGELTSKVKMGLVLNSTTMYQINTGTQRLKDIAEKALEHKKKKLSNYLHSKKSKIYNEKDKIVIQNIAEEIKKENFQLAISIYLENTMKELISTANRMDTLFKKHGVTMEGTPEEQRDAAYTLREIKNFYSAHIEPLEDISTLSHTLKRDALDEEVDMEKITQLELSAYQIVKIMNDLNTDYSKMSTALVTNMLKPVLHGGQDVIIPFGPNAGQTISIEKLLLRAEKDINYIDAWLNSAADTNDTLLGVYDRVIKNSKEKVRHLHDEIMHNTSKAHTILTQVNGIKNTEFMFELDEGITSGYYISNIDHVKFYKAKNKFFEEISSSNLTEEEKDKELRKWIKKNTIMIEVDPSISRWERIPKSSLYPSDALSKLSPAQRDYYNFFMKAKVEEDSRVPEQRVYKYKCIQMMADTTETLLTKTNNPKHIGKTILSSMVDGWVRREDDDEFGETIAELDEQGNPIKEDMSLRKGKGSKIKVKVDFSGKKLNTIPVYYTKMLSDPSRLSKDASATLLAYSYMAINYQEMGKIVDILELGRDLMSARKVGQHKGNKILVESVNFLGQIFEKDYEKTGEVNEIVKRYNVLMEQNVYGVQKLDEGQWNIFGYEFDKAKTVDNALAITSFQVLGFNAASGINNVVMGKYQMALEGIAGEYFNFKDVAVAEKNYIEYIPGVMGEVGSYRATSKLGLITEKFDVFQDFDKDAKHKDYYKNTTVRFLGKGGVFFLQNAGEHYLQTKTLLAYMNHYKLVDSLGKEVSLFDAFEVVKDIQSGVVIDAKLQLKQGLKKVDGSEFTQIDISDITLKVAKINQSMAGIYNNSDKSAMQRYALFRLVILFRKWMVPHYNRRFQGAKYDVQLDQYREGFYRSLNTFLLSLMKDLRQGKLHMALTYNNMTDHEKSNLKRAGMEVGIFLTLCLTLLLMGSWKDDETWAGRMAQYFLRRLHLEIGTSFYPPMMILDGKKILQSPTAGMKTFETFASAANFLNLWDEIEEGKYKGHSVYYRENIRKIPLYKPIKQMLDMRTEDYMFEIFE